MKTLVWCGILAACAVAEPLTWDKLVASADEDPVIQASQKKQTAIGDRSGTRLWDDLEFEYTLDGFGFLEHDFELKLKPKAFGESSADEAYWKSQAEYQRALMNYDRSSVMYERYEHALRYVLRGQIRSIHEQLAQIAADRIEVLQAMTGSETFRLQDLVAAMEEQAAISAKLVADSNSMNDSKLKLLSFVKGYDSVSIDSNFLPTMDELKSILKNMPMDAEKYADVAAAKAKWQVNEKKAGQDAAGERNYISKIGVGYKYVHAKYKYKWVTTDYDETKGTINQEWQLQRTDDDRRTQDKFYASIAIRLPFFSGKNTSNLKRQIDVLESERDYQEAKRDLTQKVERLREEILGLIAERDVQQKFVEQVDQGALFEDFATKAGNDPLLLLRAKESSLQSQLKIVQLDMDIFTIYLDMLDRMGALARTDVTNHLKAGPAK